MRLQNPHTEQHAQLEQFLEQELPIRALAHLTFPYQVQQEEADDHFHRWIKTIQEAERTQVGYVLGYERTSNIPLHLHTALISPKPLDIALLKELWRIRTGERHENTILASEYQPGLGGLSYVMKGDDEDLCNLRFSKNLPLFGRAPLPDYIEGLNAKDRRRLRRIHRSPALWACLSHRNAR